MEKTLVDVIWSFLGRYPAEVIAGCALFLTIYQAFITRWHNVLSVRPHLTTFINRHNAPGQSALAFRLMNNGLGPAFIHSFEIFLDGERITDFDVALKKVLGPRQYNHTITTLGNDYAMPAGEVRDLLVVVLPLSDGETLKDIEKQLNRFDLFVKYASAYKKRATLDTRKEKNNADTAPVGSRGL